jgi:hypothetical protein
MSVAQPGRLPMPSSPLDELKRTLADQGLYSPPAEGHSPASHDDATLLSVPSPFLSFGTR